MADRDDQPLVSTEHVIVRRWRVSESDRFVDIYRRDEVVRWLGGEPIREARQAREMIERNLERQRGGSRFGSWAIVERRTGVPAGSVMLQPLPDGDGEVEIGWHLHPDRWGRGYATEAARAVLQRSLAEGLPEIWAVTFLDNARSAAVCRRIGMRLLGVTSRWYHEPHLMFWAAPRVISNRRSPLTPAHLERGTAGSHAGTDLGVRRFRSPDTQSPALAARLTAMLCHGRCAPVPRDRDG